MTRVKKIIAIMSAILMLGAVIYQVSATEGVEEYLDAPVMTTADGAIEGDGFEYDLLEDEVYLQDEEQAFELDDLDILQGDSLWLDCDGFEYQMNEEGEFQGIAPMFGVLGELNLTVFCYYTNVQLSRNIVTEVFWNTTPPSAFSVSFPAQEIPPIPQGWNFHRVYIRYTLLGEPIAFEPMYQVGEMMQYTFSVEFSEEGSFYLNPAFVVIWRPDHPPISKEAEPVYPATFPVFVGDIVEYTITVTNYAVNPIPLLFTTLPSWSLTSFDGFRVVDNLPAELSLIESSVSVLGGTGVVDNSCAIEDRIDVTFNLPTYGEPGNPVVITFLAQVTHAALGVDEIVNVAYLYHPNYEYPIDYDRERIPVVRPRLAKDAIYVNGLPFTDQTRVSDGDIITYRLRVNNPSERVLNDFLVVDELPAGLSLIGVEQVIPSTALVDNLSIGNTVSVVLNLPPGNTDVIFTARVDDVTLAVDGDFVNIATLYGPPPEGGGQRPPVDNDREDVPTRPPGVSLEKSVSSPTVNPGESLTYRLVVRNTGGAVLTNVVVTDDLPIQLTQPRNLVITPENAGTGYFVGQLLTVNIPRLGIDEEVIITFEVTVAANVAPGSTIVNIAEVTTDQEVYDECDARVSVNIPPHYRPPGISLEKSVSAGTVQAGGNLTYRIVVRNLGDTVLTNVVVRDNLPAQLTNPRNLAIAPAGVGSGSFAGQVLTVTIPVLGIDQAVTITFDVTVAAGVANNTVIRNVASVTTDEGPSAQDDARVRVTARPPAREPGQAPLTGDYEILGSILFLFIVATTILVMMSLIKAEKRKIRKK